MALRSGLTIWCFTSPGASLTLPLTVVPYQANVQALRFTTVNPGGYGEFSFDVYVDDARIPRPELNMFSYICIMDGLTPIFVGEITEPPYGLEPGREYIRVRGLGRGNALRDDPLSRTYTNKTAQFVAQGELTLRTVTFKSLNNVVDADNTLLFPDNPAATNSYGYDNSTMEEILTDLCLKASNTTNIYTWWTQAHPYNRDAAGLPTLQVVAKLEDYSTVTFQASVNAKEVVEYSVTPSAERSANVVSIAYNNGSGGVTYANATDSRLAGDDSQGTAPFRWRRITRDLSNVTTVTSTLASQIATWLLAQYQSGSNKVHIVLRGCRDVNGNPVELWNVQAFAGSATTNIAVPEAAVRGATLPTTYTAGVNLHHIRSTTYSETTEYAELTIDCDNFADGAAAMIARLQQAADLKARTVKTGAAVQGNGQPIVGGCGFGGISTSAGGTYKSWVAFPQQAATTPTSVTLTQSSNTNVTVAPTVSGITALGFVLNCVTPATGAFIYTGTYVTAGN